MSRQELADQTRLLMLKWKDEMKLLWLWIYSGCYWPIIYQTYAKFAFAAQSKHCQFTKQFSILLDKANFKLSPELIDKQRLIEIKVDGVALYLLII